MGYYYDGWAHYVSVAERRRKAAQAAAKATKSGAQLSPVAAFRGAIAKTFWGKAWNDNLEAYSDYANRLPRGRTYVRNGSVIDLRIAGGEVKAQVMGSSLYKVAVKVAAVAPNQWQTISRDCAGSIDSLVELLQGKLSTAVMQRICAPRTGLFPAPRELGFSCSCPDGARMCKHVAAVLYGVGARLDQQPELLFSLRQVDAKDLVREAGAGLPTSKQRPAAGKVLADSMLADVFGIEMDESLAQGSSAEPAAAVKGRMPVAARTTAGKTAAAGKFATNKKPAPAKATKGKAPAPAKATTSRAPAPARGTTGKVPVAVGAQAGKVPKAKAAGAALKKLPAPAATGKQAPSPKTAAKRAPVRRRTA